MSHSLKQRYSLLQFLDFIPYGHFRPTQVCRRRNTPRPIYELLFVGFSRPMATKECSMPSFCSRIMCNYSHDVRNRCRSLGREVSKTPMPLVLRNYRHSVGDVLKRDLSEM